MEAPDGHYLGEPYTDGSGRVIVPDSAGDVMAVIDNGVPHYPYRRTADGYLYEARVSTSALHGQIGNGEVILLPY